MVPSALAHTFTPVIKWNMSRLWHKEFVMVPSALAHTLTPIIKWQMTRLWHKQYVTVPSTLTHTFTPIIKWWDKIYGKRNVSWCQVHLLTPVVKWQMPRDKIMAQGMGHGAKHTRSHIEWFPSIIKWPRYVTAKENFRVKSHSQVNRRYNTSPAQIAALEKGGGGGVEGKTKTDKDTSVWESKRTSIQTKLLLSCSESLMGGQSDKYKVNVPASVYCCGFVWVFFFSISAI